MSFNVKEVIPLQHHSQKDICATRPKYRQGRKDTAVKVYTINQESKYLLIIGVPAVGAQEELHSMCSTYGNIVNLYPLDDYPCDDFTETYLVSFERLQSARFAKRKLDTRSFFGGVLHVCYAPEFETPDETREKLIERQKYVGRSTQSGFSGPWDTRQRYPKHAPPTSAETSLTNVPNPEENTYIWAGKTYTLNQSAPVVAPEPVVQQRTESTERQSNFKFVPRQLNAMKRKVDSPNVATDLPSSSSSTRETHIWNKVSKLSAPTLDVRFKRKKHN